jgi:prepilin-type N-terminal cleavage/methylation domain-containing protein
MHITGTAQRGFTLIELSIVLVIIGLIVGGLLMGQDLIHAAAVRATISQIEKYQTAANTFRGKYGYLPGDIKDPDASMFGFAARGQYAGEGDGNGVIMGIASDAANSVLYRGALTGEAAMFWVDLSKAGLIDGTFNTATPTAIPTSGATIDNYFPQAKTGHGGYVYIWGGGWPEFRAGNIPGDGANYFCITRVTGNSPPTYPNTQAALTVSEAYAIDKKIDDGQPQGGNVLAMDSIWWASGGSFLNGDFDPGNGGPVVAGDGEVTAPSSTTCYDNGSVAGGTELLFRYGGRSYKGMLQRVFFRLVRGYRCIALVPACIAPGGLDSALGVS